MWTVILLTALALVAAATGDDCKCPKNIGKYYSELGCKAVKEGGACCPTKYDCGMVATREKEKCYLKTKAYEPNARITSAEADNPCVPECRCSKFGPQASFQCTHNDCPELFQGSLPENCVRLYTQGTCCSTGMHCDNSTASTPTTTTTKGTTTTTKGATGSSKVAKFCQISGKLYVFGQQFYPAQQPCKKCICQKEFDGTLDGPWCTDISCGIEIHYGTKIADGCSPIHFGTDGCCPIGWRCPVSGDSVVPVPAASKKKPATTATCKFGALTLSVGDKLSKQKQCVDCACVVPPHVTCVQKGYC